jgi:hypothetical protein
LRDDADDGSAPKLILQRREHDDTSVERPAKRRLDVGGSS